MIFGVDSVVVIIVFFEKKLFSGGVFIRVSVVNVKLKKV